MENSSQIKKVQQLLDKMGTYIENTTWRNKYSLALKNLHEELNSPCVLAVAGKVKAGKSFLVNALLGVDLAMTGTTETTATINIFKKGIPPSKDKPILCIYVDGHKEWISKEYLESLQGTSEEALKKTSLIDKLVIYINDNPLLDHVTLVDTPGIGAEVGEDGDSHQIHTDSYFKLRERHQQDTINLSNTADAIIYLFNTVPTETDKEFLTSLYDGGNGITSLNGIGVLSKIDKDIEQVDNVSKFSKEFELNLFTIMPTSAAVEKYLPNYEKACKLREILRQCFPDEKGFILALGSETAFLHERLPYCNTPVIERKKIINSFSEKDLVWSSFALIIKELYYSIDIESSLQKIKNIGGLENLRSIIFNHFFNRSNILRCNKIIEEIRRIITNITYDESYIFAEDYASMKEECMQACQNLSPRIKDIMIKLVSLNIPSLSTIRKDKENLTKLKIELETIQNEIKIVNESYMSYQKVIASREHFSQDEFNELCSLFAGQTIDNNSIERYKYWSATYNMSPTNSIRQQVSKIAKNKYMERLK